MPMAPQSGRMENEVLVRLADIARWTRPPAARKSAGL
jgi:hypothetical protein